MNFLRKFNKMPLNCFIAIQGLGWGGGKKGSLGIQKCSCYFSFWKSGKKNLIENASFLTYVEEENTDTRETNTVSIFKYWFNEMQITPRYMSWSPLFSSRDSLKEAGRVSRWASQRVQSFMLSSSLHSSPAVVSLALSSSWFLQQPSLESLPM